ncbi:MAG: putative solute-binding protein [Gammaproteobacteria bacterium]
MKLFRTFSRALAATVIAAGLVPAALALEIGGKDYKAPADLAAPKPVAGPALKRKFCVWDIAGTNGPIYSAMSDLRIGILRFGIDFELVAYTNERIASEDFKAGRCDAVNVMTLRARNFIKYAGTLDAIGAVPDEAHLRLALEALADPRSAPKLRSGPYEVAAFVPIGPAYIFTNDRKVTSIARAAGKRVAVLDDDPTMSKMVAGIGAAPVPVNVTNFAGKFNNGTVDIIAAPLAAYAPFELHKGLEPNGGIVRFPLTFLTAQVLVRSDKFPADMLQYSRSLVSRHFSSTMEILNAMAGDVPAKYWVDIPKSDTLRYELMMREARIQLREEGYYDGEMLSMLRKVRCKLDPNRGECADKQE